MRCEVATKCLLLFASHSHSDETRTIKIFQQLDLDTGLLLAYLCFQILPCSVVSCVEGAWKEKCCFGNHLICTLFQHYFFIWRHSDILHIPCEKSMYVCMLYHKFCPHILFRSLTKIFEKINYYVWNIKLISRPFQDPICNLIILQLFYPTSILRCGLHQ